LLRRIFTLGALGLLGGLAHGQATTPDPLAGKAALGYLATSGNTQSTNANAQLELEYDPASPWSYHFDLSAVGASNANQATAEAYSFSHKAQRNFSEHNYLFTSLNWQRDRFSGYRQQLSEAVGYGRRLLDSERQMLSIEAGLGAKQATLVDDTEQDQGIVRSALSYLLNISETASFSQRLAIESGPDNIYSEAVSKLSARIIGDISVSFSYTIKNNSTVPANVKNRDTFTSLALEYSF
jgi:putative salt-induced outer membrane protein